ncbi:MAG: hypothetical protein AB8B55_07700 [Mariniblastus sp.]
MFRQTKLNLRCLLACVAIFATCGSFSLAFADEARSKLNQSAFEILKTHCYRCHGVNQKVPDFDVLDIDSLTKERGEAGDSLKFVEPGDIDNSSMWEYMDGDDAYMPMEGSPEADKMTNDHRETIKRWIEAGAEFPKRKERKFRTRLSDFEAIRNHLLEAEPDDRRHLRFFTFSHVANNPKATEFDLKMVRAALSKLVNSLSWEREIVVPVAVESTDETLYAIDLRDLGWTGGREWLHIVNRNPYGLKLSYIKDKKLKRIAADVTQLSQAESPVVRADWFIFSAARPPLYHDLLRLPNRVEELEALVGVDTIQNIIDDKAVRAGFGRSGVSRQNRMVERHDAPFGAYWISYDFLPRRGRGDLIRYPLGPAYEDNQFKRHAFEHDGGEAIFNLPNGLQAYYLLTADGNRIDGTAPTEVVYDSAAVAGTPAIINGVSCMNCHREGMITGFRDEIRGSDAMAGEALDKVKKLYVGNEEMERLIKKDRVVFSRALNEAIGTFLLKGESKNKKVTDFADPIGRVVQRYQSDLGPNEIALELGFRSIEEIAPQIKHDRDLKKLGLGTLLQSKPGTIKRARWEAIDGTSFYQDTAVELGLGTPILPGTTQTMNTSAEQHISD